MTLANRISPKTLTLSTLSATLLASTFAVTPIQAQERDDFSVCWSIYAGWMPWAYADIEGVVDKWAGQYSINIDVIQVNDYVESINQFTSGNVDGCAMTNMDALTIPAASGVDSTALIINDYSNGNDGIVLKGSDDLADIAGRQVNLVQFSVSHYFLARALESVGLTERDIETVNTSDADIVGLFSSATTEAVAAWNPQLSAIADMPDSHVVYTSAEIPGEILDMMVVNTQTLADNPALGHALVGAWYEVMGLVEADDEHALSIMADAAGTDVEGYRQQLAATYLYTDPAEAIELMESSDLLDTMERVAEFSFEHGLLGDMAPNANVVGIETPSGVFGDEGNIKLRFDPSFTQAYLDAQ
ncbi:putative urea ABC transporter substrate-binding protein [Vreelandella olivaria]|uniref:putative urea ABC transporter substrate-binding protein n=1 Tax=Vreelandella olivaria TaxID=390919 RepID=UPI00201E763A|nr:putative urea ABC transporter substrate-binding protein [Halomonas olivaria]